MAEFGAAARRRVRVTNESKFEDAASVPGEPCFKGLPEHLRSGDVCGVAESSPQANVAGYVVPLGS